LIGRITSHLSDWQVDKTIESAMRFIAWHLVDDYLYDHHHNRLGSRKQASVQDDDVAQEYTYKCTLHTGFLSIIETTEQLCRLRDEGISLQGSPTRSRLCRTMHTEYVRPIDKTAARVARGQEVQ